MQTTLQGGLNGHKNISPNYHRDGVFVLRWCDHCHGADHLLGHVKEKEMNHDVKLIWPWFSSDITPSNYWGSWMDQYQKEWAKRIDEQFGYKAPQKPTPPTKKIEFYI